MSEGKPIDLHVAIYIWRATYLHHPIYIIHISRVSKFQRFLYSRTIWPLAGLDFVPLATFERPFVDVLRVQVLADFFGDLQLENHQLRYSER